MSLKSIKGKIRGVEKTRQVAKAMEAVSAVKMRKSQEQAISLRPYTVLAMKILKNISKNPELKNHKYLKDSDANGVLYVVLTSDRGLAGTLNTSVIKAVQKDIVFKNLTNDNVSFICIGKKGADFFSKNDFKIVKHFDEISDQISIEDIKNVSRLILEMFNENKIGTVNIAYENFASTFEQKPTLHKLLPIDVVSVETIIKEIIPDKGKYSNLFRYDSEETQGLTIFEPSQEEVLNNIVPYLINILLYHTNLEQKASEFSARMVAMKSAGDKAVEVKKFLNRKFNKIRQSNITREVSEIIGGIEALAK
jgi:F-type H+-transporting ATPase subunit gamma